MKSGKSCGRCTIPKHINTPVGWFEVPHHIQNRINNLSDIELLQEYLDKCKNFIDPFLFEEMSNRSLIFSGERRADIEKRLEAMKMIDNETDSFSIGDYEGEYEI